MAKQLLQDGKRELVITTGEYMTHCVTRKAKLLLKKKHYLEGLLDQTDTQMDNLAQMVVTLCCHGYCYYVHFIGREYRIHSS